MGQYPVQPLWFVNEFRPTQIASRLIVAGIKGVCQRCIQPCIDALHVDTREAVAQGEGIVVPAPSPHPSPFPSPPSPAAGPSSSAGSAQSGSPPPSVFPVPPPAISPAPSSSPVPAPLPPAAGSPTDSDSDGPAHIEHAPAQPQSPPQPQPQIPTQSVSVYQAWHRTAQWPLMYGRLQVHGYQRRQWIADPSVPHCNVNPCTLDISTLKTRYPFEHAPRQVSTLGIEFDPQMRSLGIISPNDPPENLPWTLVIRHDDLVWMGNTHKGMIMLRVIARKDQGSGTPQISEVSHALYTRNFPIDTLNYIFVEMIANQETRAFLSNVLYTAAYSLDRLPHSPHSWDYATPEYDALLGTPIGKIAAAIVLGAFPRGTRRIGRIVTWNSLWSVGHNNLFVHMRFDIEMNTGTPIGSGPGTTPGSATRMNSSWY